MWGLFNHALRILLCATVDFRNHAKDAAPVTGLFFRLCITHHNIALANGKARHGHGAVCIVLCTLHRAPVGQGPSGPGWLAIAFGFWSGRALATGTAWADLCLIHHHRAVCIVLFGSHVPHEADPSVVGRPTPETRKARYSPMSGVR